MYRISKFARGLAATALLLLSIAPFEARGEIRDVLVTSVAAESSTLIIRGANLESTTPGAPVRVLLGAYVAPLTIMSSSGSELVAVLPAGIRSGSYLLTVGFGVEEGQFDQSWISLATIATSVNGDVAGGETVAAGPLSHQFSSGIGAAGGFLDPFRANEAKGGINFPLEAGLLSEPVEIDIEESGTVALTLKPGDSYLGDWTLGMKGFANHSPALKKNYVVSMGWNVTSGGSVRDTTKAAGEFSMESHYAPMGGDVDGTLEMHWQFFRPNAPGVPIRALSTQFYPDGRMNSSMALTNLLFKRADNGAEIGRVTWNGLIMNGVQTNSLKVIGPSLVTGTHAVTGKLSINSAALGSNALDVYTNAPGPIAAFQTNSAANGNALLPIYVGNAVTGNLFGAKVVASTSANLYTTIQQNGAGNAVFDALVLGGGDPKSTYSVNGGRAWSVGLDQSDGSNFKVSASSALGVNDVLLIKPSGDFILGNNAAGKLYTEGGALKFRGSNGTVTTVAGP